MSNYTEFATRANEAHRAWQLVTTHLNELDAAGVRTGPAVEALNTLAAELSARCRAYDRKRIEATDEHLTELFGA